MTLQHKSNAFIFTSVRTW